jgi:hypothetical protein
MKVRKGIKEMMKGTKDEDKKETIFRSFLSGHYAHSK